jgi:hypothetical protein
MKKLIMAGAVCAAFGLSGVAAAAPAFTVTGGASYAEQGQSFEWITGNVWEGGVLGLTDQGIVKIEYIGKEAGFSDNLFNWGALSGGTQLYSTGPGDVNPVGQTAATPFPPAVAPGSATYFRTEGGGPLPFNFFVTATGRTVENGHSDTGFDDDIAFWPLPDANGGFGNVVYLLLDDGGARDVTGQTDNDHDDMVIRLTVAEVPEPSTWALMLSGLGLLGFMARRRMQS